MKKHSDNEPLICISVDDKIWLENFDDFLAIHVPLENKARYEKGLLPLNDDEVTNLFLTLREKHGIR